MAILLLALYNLLFFWQAYSQPFTLARSELLSTFFPSWIHQGRGEKYDPYYWLVPHAHPVLSTYYPLELSRLVAISRAKLDTAFKIYLWSSTLHHLIGSVGWFVLISLWASPVIALFGAVTLTYSGYNIKQQPCIVYTLAWFSWMLYGIAINNPLVAGLSLGLTLLAGYYPIGLQTILIAIGAAILWGANLWFVPIGFLIGSIQLVPFLRYLPKTIRTNKHDDLGRVPWWHFLSLLLPTSFRSYVNGVGFWEMSYYVGIVPLVIIAYDAANITSRVWILGVVSICLSLGIFSKYLPRIPARWLFSLQFSLGWMATACLNQIQLSSTAAIWGLLFIQATDLLINNSDLVPTRPYAELYEKPSRAFNTPLTRYLEANLWQNRVSGLPYPIFTGHINRLRTLGYSGGMQLKLMAKWRNDTNPNGSGEHDYFRNNADDRKLDISRVLYAYTTKRIPWRSTEVQNLWRNPRLPK